MKDGDCGKCHWFQAQGDSRTVVTGSCLESPPTVMLLPMQVQPSSKLIDPNKPPQAQQGFGLQAVYPVVPVESRCSRFKARLADTH